jgi:hypothetical protein
MRLSIVVATYFFIESSGIVKSVGALLVFVFR